MSDAHSTNEDSHAGARHFCDTIRTRLAPEKRKNVFVAGCGLGHEALHIRQNLDVPVAGVDIDQHWDPTFGAGIEDFELRKSSILNIPFAEETFDVVFYHHVIEHVDDPQKSLDELARILVPGGFIYVGTPNRHRAVGYIGSHDATTAKKIKWNVVDYRARLKGKFRNEHGAHAGFSQKELAELLANKFTGIESLTSDYLHYKYQHRIPGAALDVLCRKPLIGVSAPSVYAIATKRPV